MVDRDVGGKKLHGDGFEWKFKDETQRVEIIISTCLEKEKYRNFFFF